MINFETIANGNLNRQPFPWVEINNLFYIRDGSALASSYPTDHFKTVNGGDGEKKYSYQVRSLLPMGQSRISFPEKLSPEWLALAQDILSPAYREAVSLRTGYDLRQVPLECNVYHYDPGAHLGPHIDLPDKLVVHVLYFNESWDLKHGGFLAILNSADPVDVDTRVLPTIGNSALFVRCDHSWHEVKPVNESCRESRRSMVITFYKPNSPSTMWPPGETPSLHDYSGISR